MKQWILSALLLGLLSSGLSKSTSSPEDYEEIPQGDEDEYGDDDSSRNNEALQNNDVAIDIDPPPYFNVPSITINASKGDDVILHCDAKNLPKNHVAIWYNGSQVITTGKNVINMEKVTSFNDTMIRINNVEYSDRNQYMCSILPHQVNFTILLNVLHERRAVAIYSRGRDVTERSMTFRQGERVEFECRALGMDDATIKWSLNGERAANHVQITNGKVIIESIDEHQAGTYQCLGDDGTEGNLPHGSITINVHYTPKISTHRHFVNTKQGGRAELACDYKAEPIAVVEWKRYLSNQHETIPTISDKYTIKNSLHKGKNTTILFVKDVNRDDLGEYQCYAKNSIGSAHANIHLIYEPEKPRFENKMINGRKATIHWLVRSEQQIDEAVIDYKLNATLSKWKTESISTRSRSDLHSGVWKLTHELELPPGTWHVRIKVKNSENWSKFSDEEIIKIEDPTDTPPEDIVYAGDIAGKMNNNSNRLTLPLFLTIFLLLVLRIVPSI